MRFHPHLLLLSSFLPVSLAWIAQSATPKSALRQPSLLFSSTPTTTADPTSTPTTTTLDGNEIRQDIAAVSNILVVKVKDTLTATAGGILLPDQSQERPTEGLVLVAGPGKIHPMTGVRITNPITAGMSVL